MKGYKGPISRYPIGYSEFSGYSVPIYQRIDTRKHTDIDDVLKSLEEPKRSLLRRLIKRMLGK